MTDVALIEIIEDFKTVTKELLRTRDDVIVYHLLYGVIVIEMRNPIGLSFFGHEFLWYYKILLIHHLFKIIVKAMSFLLSRLFW